MNITGILLAGGKSSRMGTEKGMIRIHDRELMSFPLNALESVCDQIMISTCNDTFKYHDYQVVCDEIPGLGPLGGIFTCLKKSASEINLVLSYDMPFVTPDLLKYIISHSCEYEITAPSLKDQLPEPLCTVYMKSTIPAIQKSVRKKNYKVNDLFSVASFNHLIIDNTLPFYNPYLFYNVNKPEEFEKIQTIIRTRHFNPEKNNEGITGE